MLIRTGLVSITVASWLSVATGQQVTSIEFEPEAPEFADDAAEYQQIWTHEGERIVAALERATSLELERQPISAVVYEGPSFSGDRERPMRMRASYAPDTKRGTLVHELGHRLLGGIEPQDFDHHPVLYLFLYDVWVDLWGRDFADAQVAVESRRRGMYDYEGAWNVHPSRSPGRPNGYRHTERRAGCRAPARAATTVCVSFQFSPSANSRRPVSSSPSLR